jgi:hypothetical protein
MSGILHIADQTGTRSLRLRALFLLLPLGSVMGYAAHEEVGVTPMSVAAPSAAPSEASFLQQLHMPHGVQGGVVTGDLLEGSLLQPLKPDVPAWRSNCATTPTAITSGSLPEMPCNPIGQTSRSISAAEMPRSSSR